MPRSDVIDTGVGIAADFLPTDFRPLRPGGPVARPKPGGLGIGLTLVRDLVERHGGSISVRSEGLGMGSEFIVRLPTDRRCRQPAPVLLDDGEAFRRRGRSGFSWSTTTSTPRRALAVVLQLWGHDVLVAHDGPSALDSAPIYRPEVVLLDIGLPGMDGYRVAEEIRKLPDLAEIAHPRHDRLCRRRGPTPVRRAGFVLHLVKPLDLDALERYLADFEPSIRAPDPIIEPASTADGLPET